MQSHSLSLGTLEYKSHIKHFRQLEICILYYAETHRNRNQTIIQKGQVQIFSFCFQINTPVLVNSLAYSLLLPFSHAVSSTLGYELAPSLQLGGIPVLSSHNPCSLRTRLPLPHASKRVLVCWAEEHVEASAAAPEQAYYSPDSVNGIQMGSQHSHA